MVIEENRLFSFQASCIDSTAAPEAVFADEVKKLQSEKLKPKEQITLEPYERDHAIVVGNYRLANILCEPLALIHLPFILDQPARARVRMTALKKPWRNNCIGKLCSTILCRLSMPVICTVLFLLLIKNNKHICETEKRRKKLSIDVIDAFLFNSVIHGDVLDQQRLMTYLNWCFFSIVLPDDLISDFRIDGLLSSTQSVFEHIKVWRRRKWQPTSCQN